MKTLMAVVVSVTLIVVLRPEAASAQQAPYCGAVPTAPGCATTTSTTTPTTTTTTTPAPSPSSNGAYETATTTGAFEVPTAPAPSPPTTASPTLETTTTTGAPVVAAASAGGAPADQDGAPWWRLPFAVLGILIVIAYVGMAEAREARLREAR